MLTSMFCFEINKWWYQTFAKSPVFLIRYEHVEQKTKHSNQGFDHSYILPPRPVYNIIYH